MPKKMQRYPKPKEVGGRLIREVVTFLKSQKVELPLTSDILIAISGGCDSVALGHLLFHFGRRIVDPSRIRFLHINHGWRGEESNDDEVFVEDLGKKWGVSVITHRLSPPTLQTKNSWEEEARAERKKIYALETEKNNAVVFTAHHADDLAETVIWRLLTGAAQSHGGGVAFRHGVEMRPFLKVRKQQIREYLLEVGEVYREDSTNLSDRFLRARMRSSLMPEMEKLFPKAVDHLVKLALDAQIQSQKSDIQNFDATWGPHEILLQASGLKARRAHLNLISEKLVAKKAWYGEIHLPGGWRLIREQTVHQKRSSSKATIRARQGPEPPLERWILERI